MNKKIAILFLWIFVLLTGCLPSIQADSGSGPWYWCDSTGGYYPEVASCSKPWRIVIASSRPENPMPPANVAPVFLAPQDPQRPAQPVQQIPFSSYVPPPPERLNTMHHPQIVRLGKQNCDDYALATGDGNYAEQCKMKIDEGIRQIDEMSKNPDIPKTYWNACSEAAAIPSSYDYMGWAQCVRFAMNSCQKLGPTIPDLNTREFGGMLKCMRAIESEGWLMNPKSQ